MVSVLQAPKICDRIPAVFLILTIQISNEKAHKNSPNNW